MMELASRTAFVTGGASGIGFALGQAFAQEGMNVMLADIEGEALGSAVRKLSGAGVDVAGIVCDVADPASVEKAAEATFARFGAVHLLCNNAGVAAGSGVDDVSVETWRWVLDVNVMGVLHGLRSFLPRMRTHGKGGHIVNTASMAGLNSGLGFSPYSASKFALVNMSEGLAAELAPSGIGVTVVCPGFVRTRIAESNRNRQQRYGPASAPVPGSHAATLGAALAELGKAGLDPLDVAKRVVTAIRRNDLYVFTHTGAQWRSELEQRFGGILAAMDRAAADEPD
jgi:NAD(P)-dependent dehydrogenase (short-subunit alcohol dehydrogenase family)